MKRAAASNSRISRERLEKVYSSEKMSLLSRVRKSGRTWEEAEDLVHDVYVELTEGLDLIAGINNLPAWIHSLITRRMIDAWRHDKVRRDSGETDVAEETLREIIAGTGLNPLDSFVRENLVDAMNAAIKALPPAQRSIIEAQVFGGKTFRDVAEITGENVDTLKARKRYALKNLSGALRHWIND